MPINPSEVTALAREMQALRSELDEGHLSWREQEKKEQALWQRVKDMDWRAGKGLQVGKLISISFADGYANYIVRDVKPRTVSVVHVPLFDAWDDRDVVSDKGSMVRRVAENNIHQRERLSEILRGAD